MQFHWTVSWQQITTKLLALCLFSVKIKNETQTDRTMEKVIPIYHSFSNFYTVKAYEKSFHIIMQKLATCTMNQVFISLLVGKQKFKEILEQL